MFWEALARLDGVVKTLHLRSTLLCLIICNISIITTYSYAEMIEVYYVSHPKGTSCRAHMKLVT